MHVRVIGVGSGCGDDAAGLAVIDWLAERARGGDVSFASCRRPLPDLLDAFEGADAAVLVDAARGAGPPGRVRVLDPGAIARRGRASSHGLGVREVLELAQDLGRAPARIAWVGIAIGPPLPGAELSAAVRAAIPEAGRRVLEAVSRLSAPGAQERPDA